MTESGQLGLFAEERGMDPTPGHARTANITLSLELYPDALLSIVDKEPEQLALDLRSDVIRLGRRTRSAFLGMRATSLFRRSIGLRRVALEYRTRGVVFIGDLLRRPSDELQRLLCRPERIRQ